MVGNTFPYTIHDWRKDIELAHEHGFDGFALNVGKEQWQFDRVKDAFEAARYSRLDFRLFMSFDMASIPSTSKNDVSHLRQYLVTFANHSHYMSYRNGAIVSTFAGESSFFGFGEGRLDEAWGYVKGDLERSIGRAIHFIPSFFIDPARYPSLPCMDGYFHWNGGWPIHLTPSSPRSEISQPKLDSDTPHLHHLGGKTYMAAVSPWFFTHYGKDSWNKNWIYRGDDHLLVRRWVHLMSIRNQVDIVQVISWNDYGESHYVAPPRGAQPNSEAWVNTCPHDAWLSLNAYFIRAFKRGWYPHQRPEEAEGPGERDTIWMWARPHTKDVVAQHDPVGKPDGWQLADDLFWVVALATHPSLLTISSPGEPHSQSESHTRTYNLVQPGIHIFSHPMVAGRGMKAEMIRDGRHVAVCDPAGFRFESRPKIYNFNAFVCQS
ncbi:glycoside hydrolase family 71 protein [Cristinia sonorae]|uniref:Glycoside hydrolase family 71 protein n=1 Tax=Cristinia sonorae TaxID=1940300 RepID=A0A8K0UT25_9AGAR|nr:glycoside hydrolase family 71 protein [Cristinia sonorae]